MLGRVEGEDLAARIEAVHAALEPLSVHVPINVGRCGLGFELRQANSNGIARAWRSTRPELPGMRGTAAPAVREMRRAREQPPT